MSHEQGAINAHLPQSSRLNAHCSKLSVAYNNGMSRDIAALLAGWSFDPERMNVRIIRGDDGRDKIQIRLDLGVLQMDFDGRPDGLRIEGYDSWFDLLQARAKAHEEAHPDGPPFFLEHADCVHLQREGAQYYHRYHSFWQLGRYELCARDTARNLRMLAFVREHARQDDDRRLLDQFRPYITMVHTWAVATPLVELNDLHTALKAIEAGIDAIRQFLVDHDVLQNADACVELQQLLQWRTVLVKRQANLPLLGTDVQNVEALKAKLERAIADERFEDAAKLRDEIRKLSGNIATDPGPAMG
jgi:hypothetical protein